MILQDDTFRVEVGDAALVFEQPDLRSLALMEAITRGLHERDLGQVAEVVFEGLVAVENLFYRDGTPVTVESLRQGRVKVGFLTRLVPLYVEGLNASFRGAELGNGSTPDSSASSGTTSTTPA